MRLYLCESLYFSVSVVTYFLPYLYFGCDGKLGFKGQPGQTLCPCCSRRSMLTSLGVALASTVGGKKSLSAGPTDLDAEVLLYPSKCDRLHSLRL